MENANKILNIDSDSNDAFSAPNPRGTPERNLLMAVLERAILDYVGNDEREIEAVEHWIFSDPLFNSDSEFSFGWICEQLDLTPDSVAKLIGSMPKRGARRVAPWYFKDTQWREAV